MEIRTKKELNLTKSAASFQCIASKIKLRRISKNLVWNFKANDHIEYHARSPIPLWDPFTILPIYLFAYTTWSTTRNPLPLADFPITFEIQAPKKSRKQTEETWESRPRSSVITNSPQYSQFGSYSQWLTRYDVFYDFSNWINFL